MSTRAVIVHPGAAPPIAAGAPAARLLAAFLAGRSPRTVRAYGADLDCLAAWLGTSREAAVQQLLGCAHGGQLNELALGFRQYQSAQGLAPATVNRRLSAVRSVLRLGRLLGMTPHTVEVPSLPAQTLRDTRGPGADGFRQLLAQLDGQAGARAVRDRAILRLLFDLALRRAEVCSLDLEHLDLERGVLQVLGKGRSQREPLTLPGPTKTALRAWLAARPAGGVALFTSFDRGRKGDGRLTGGSVYAIVRGLGERIGMRAWPHGLRHAAITEALDRTGGDVRRVRMFSRHANVQTVLRYDDARQDLAGAVADLVAGDG